MTQKRLGNTGLEFITNANARHVLTCPPSLYIENKIKKEHKKLNGAETFPVF